MFGINGKDFKRLYCPKCFDLSSPPKCGCHLKFGKENYFFNVILVKIPLALLFGSIIALTARYVLT